MKPAPFDYLRAGDLNEATTALAEVGEDARVLAGGQSLVAMLNMRLARPQLIVDIMAVSDGPALRVEGDMLVVPAHITQAELILRTDLTAQVPLLACGLPWVGHWQTRTKGTVCGSIAHADPSAELPLILATLDGVVMLRSKTGRREVPAPEFFHGMMLTDCAPDELIEAVCFPLSPRGAFHEVGRRKGDFAIVACAALRQGERTRLAIGGVDDVPAIQDWDNLDDGQLDDALNEFAWSLDARDDLHASARYRRELVRRLGRKTIEEAWACG
ncbi:MAG: FAD binding domain-containing protein, partial [Pseudomonadota bacterium]